eukprot:m.157015 g.157015  ORF g.157015 m.157015 type:complete len:315 (-) comp31036_c3_seq1:67-1011(-)
MADRTVIYGLEDGYLARALAPVAPDDDERVEFLIGTQSLRNTNQLHQLTYDEEADSLDVTVYNHAVGEVWHISTPATERELVATCHANAAEKTHGATVWKIPEQDETESDQPLDLTPLFQIKSDGSKRSQNIVWQPTDVSQLVNLCDESIELWDVNVGTETAKMTKSATETSIGNFTNCRWNPHHNCAYIATASGKSLRGWDLRTMEQTFCIQRAHGDSIVRSLDFNANKQYNMLSCGNDGKIKFWDVRNDSQSLLEFSLHTHWVWCARYNQYHDQLVVSSGSDNQVALSNAGSLSSILYADLDNDDDDDEKQQ